MGAVARGPRGRRSRTCVGCRCSDSYDQLVRLIATPDGRVVFDLAGHTFGRGAWVHPRLECLAKSVRGMGHALRQPIHQSVAELHGALVSAAWRRIHGLLIAAKRAGYLAVGAEAASDAWQRRRLGLLLLALDAKAGSRLPWIADAVQEAKVLVAPPKAEMGKLLGVHEVALAAITDSRLAKAVARNMAIAQIPAPAIDSRGSDKGTEVG